MKLKLLYDDRRSGRHGITSLNVILRREIRVLVVKEECTHARHDNVALKLCVLFFYRRVFDSKFKPVANIIGAVVIALWSAVILVSIFSCNPLRGSKI